jgi:hypothetical protein
VKEGGGIGYRLMQVLGLVGSSLVQPPVRPSYYLLLATKLFMAPGPRTHEANADLKTFASVHALAELPIEI